MNHFIPFTHGLRAQLSHWAISIYDYFYKSLTGRRGSACTYFFAYDLFHIVLFIVLILCLLSGKEGCN